MSQLVQSRSINPPTTSLLHVLDRWSLHYWYCLKHESTICQISLHNHFFHMHSTVFTVFSTEKNIVFYCQWQRFYLKDLWRLYWMISDFSICNCSWIRYFFPIISYIYLLTFVENYYSLLTYYTYIHIYLFLILVLVFKQLLRISCFITDLHDIKL